MVRVGRQELRPVGVELLLLLILMVSQSGRASLTISKVNDILRNTIGFPVPVNFNATLTGVRDWMQTKSATELFIQQNKQKIMDAYNQYKVSVKLIKLYA